MLLQMAAPSLPTASGLQCVCVCACVCGGRGERCEGLGHIVLGGASDALVFGKIGRGNP